MSLKLARVIKKEKIKIDGSCSLKYEPDFSTTTDPSQAQQARIVSCDKEYALIEVCCNCGQKFYLKCNFADMADASLS